MSAIKKFTGFKGVAAILQIGDIQFIVVAATQRKLEQLHYAIVPNAGPFNPEACQKSVVVHADLLREKPAKISSKTKPQIIDVVTQ